MAPTQQIRPRVSEPIIVVPQANYQSKPYDSRVYGRQGPRASIGTHTSSKALLNVLILV